MVSITRRTNLAICYYGTIVLFGIIHNVTHAQQQQQQQQQQQARKHLRSNHHHTNGNNNRHQRRMKYLEKYTHVPQQQHGTLELEVNTRKKSKEEAKEKEEGTPASTLPSEAPSNTVAVLHKSIKGTPIPSAKPSTKPSAVPSFYPSHSPSTKPTMVPSGIPSVKPSDVPSTRPSNLPSTTPSNVPSDIPSGLPSMVPSNVPSLSPSTKPSTEPSATPTQVPSAAPSAAPSTQPSTLPSTQPSTLPTNVPSSAPTSCSYYLSNFTCTNNSADCKYLLDIFTALNGCEWTIRTNWLVPGSDHCTWYGITCTSSVLDSQGTEITELNLSRNNLRGTLPPNIGRLYHLDTIDMSYNYLTGVIPTSLGNLYSLQVLQLASNSYDIRTSTTDNDSIVPEQICNLPNLFVLSTDCGNPQKVQCTCCNLCTNTPEPSVAPDSVYTPAPTYNLTPTNTPSTSAMPTCSSSEVLSEFTCEGYNLRTTCEVLVELYTVLNGCGWVFPEDDDDVSSSNRYLLDKNVLETGTMSGKYKGNTNTNGTISSTNSDSDATVWYLSGTGAVGTNDWFTNVPPDDDTIYPGTIDPFCFWKGLSCENSDCTNGCDVTKIDLWNLPGLAGTIPSSIHQLYQLKVLELHDNAYLRGTIPTEVALLPSLQVLRLDGTSITGTYDYLEDDADATDSSSNVCTLIENGTLLNFWMDCTGRDGSRYNSLLCECCTYCTLVHPSANPTSSPSTSPSDLPSLSLAPSDIPTQIPSVTPSDIPTYIPSVSPSNIPTQIPSNKPTQIPSSTPSEVPTHVPSVSPTLSRTPSVVPTNVPTSDPTSGCYEPEDYICQVTDDATQSVYSYDCILDDAQSACDITQCINNVATPANVCCSCNNRVVAGNVYPSATPTAVPTEAPSISPAPTKVASTVPSATPTDTPSLSTNPTNGCYEPVDYKCQVVDPGGTGILPGRELTCSNTHVAEGICDIVSCYRASIAHPADACCACQDPVRNNLGVPPSESPSASPII